MIFLNSAQPAARPATLMTANESTIQTTPLSSLEIQVPVGDPPAKDPRIANCAVQVVTVSHYNVIAAYRLPHLGWSKLSFT